MTQSRSGGKSKKSPSIEESTKGGSRGTKGTRKGGGMSRTVRHMIKRKNCVWCLVISLVLLAVFFGASAWMTYFTVHNWNRIKEYEAKQAKLAARTDVTAFYEIVCPIYGKGDKGMTANWSDWDMTFCNRYCGNNEPFEFMFRQIDTNGKFDAENRGGIPDDKCPPFIELRPCQEPDDIKKGHCEEQEFDEDYFSVEPKKGDGNPTDTNKKQQGICVPC